MAQEREAAAQPYVVRPAVPSSGGEVVPAPARFPAGRDRAAPQPSAVWAPGIDAQGPVVDVPPEAVAVDVEQRNAEYERLLRLCRHNRRTDRCPGRCVLRDELGQSGTAAFLREVQR